MGDEPLQNNHAAAALHPARHTASRRHLSAAIHVKSPMTRFGRLITDVGLGHLMKSLDEDAAWDHVLSGGEKQRIAFARLFSHRPNLIIMDEATSALDPASQTQMMNLLIDRLPDAAVVSIAHRPELEAFHNRKLIFEHRPGGSHLVSKNISMATEHIASLQPGKATRLRLLPAVKS